MFTSLRNDWCTPIELFKELNDVYNFDIDLCADHKNHLCNEYIYGKCEIIFIKGRLKFSNSKNSAPFPSMICIY